MRFFLTGWLYLYLRSRCCTIFFLVARVWWAFIKLEPRKLLSTWMPACFFSPRFHGIQACSPFYWSLFLGNLNVGRIYVGVFGRRHFLKLYCLFLFVWGSFSLQFLRFVFLESCEAQGKVSSRARQRKIRARLDIQPHKLSFVSVQTDTGRWFTDWYFWWCKFFLILADKDMYLSYKVCFMYRRKEKLYCFNYFSTLLIRRKKLCVVTWKGSMNLRHGKNICI